MLEVTSANAFTVAIAGLVGLILYQHFRVFSYWKVRGIDGPRPWPIFGTLIYYFFKNKIDVDLEWRKRYGHTYGLFEGFKPVLRTTDNNLIKHVFIKDFNSFTDRNTGAINGDLIRRWLLFSKGKVWTNQRALITPMFTSAKMHAMFSTMAECKERFLEQVVGQKTRAQGDGKPVQISRRDISLMTLDTIASAFYGLNLNVYSEKHSEFIRQADNLGRMNILRYILHSCTPSRVARYFKFDIAPSSDFDYFDKLCKQLIEDRRKNLSTKAQNGQAAKSAAPDFVRALIEAKLDVNNYEKVYTKEDNRDAHYNNQQSVEELEKVNESQTKSAQLFRSFSDIEIRGQLTFLLVASYETTATSLGFCLFELAHRPEVQEELFEELKDAQRQPLKATDPSEQQHEHYTRIVDLKKLDAFLSEVLRLYCPLTDINRVVTAEEGATLPTEPKPLKLPYKSVIATAGYVLQRDEDYFERPNEFDLTRFYPENRHKIKPATFMPFGLGPRQCVGFRFAILDMKLFLAKLILKYKILPATDDQHYPSEYKRHPIFLQIKAESYRFLARRDNEQEKEN